MAIYQQARPVTFDQVIGQDHVKTVLMASLKRGKIGHAYLFSGPRGVGKTTTARLLAMAVNCEHKDASQRPCSVCTSCQLVRKGNHPDVIELDAASNNSVEDIRDLREKVRLAAMRGGSRVWVLDEAHMLSRAAANALLKTLEEPPEKLVFILATTEPEKLPPTILSRCQHFRFRRLSEAEILSKLEQLCQQAQVEAEGDALRLIARAADGAMRDAESLLERLLVTGEIISRQKAEDALGLPPQEQMRRLASYLCTQDLASLFALATDLYFAGFAPSSLTDHLTQTVRDALAAKILGDEDFQLQLSSEDLLRLIHALDDEKDRFTKRDNLFSLEVALIKAMNALSRNTPKEQLPLATESLQGPSTSTLPAFDPFAKAAKPKDDATAREPLMVSDSSETSGSAGLSWHKIKKAADPRLKAFLMPAREHVEGKTLQLSFDERHKFHYGQLKNHVEELLELIRQLYGEGFELVLDGPGGSLRKKA